MEASELELSAKRVAEARADTSGRVYRVYADGVFDLFHVGHANMLRQAKHALGAPEKTHLLVGVCSDALTHAHKGKTILDHETRCASVAQCRWADEVVADAPWVITQAFLDAHAIDFVAHDAAPYADSSGGGGDVYAFVKAQGRFLATQRTEGISTSDILLSIVRDYDAYVRRNLDRGYSPEQMNLGPLWRARATEKRRRSEVQRALQQTRADLHGVEDAALAFVRLFHPAGRAAVSPVAALLADPSPVRQRTLGVLHALRLLGRALRADCRSVGSYLNVFGYLPPRWRPFAAISVACAACAAAVRLLLLQRHN